MYFITWKYVNNNNQTELQRLISTTSLLQSDIPFAECVLFRAALGAAVRACFAVISTEVFCDWQIPAVRFTVSSLIWWKLVSLIINAICYSITYSGGVI